jgi:hypothetical protein
MAVILQSDHDTTAEQRKNVTLPTKGLSAVSRKVLCVNTEGRRQEGSFDLLIYIIALVSREVLFIVRPFEYSHFFIGVLFHL